MLRMMAKAKIHNATVTDTDLYYAGSIGIDREIMEAVDLLPDEWVAVVNCNNGARFETYVIRGERGSGMICLNGPAARLGHEGDTIHILTYVAIAGEELRNFKPAILILDEKNDIIEEK